MNCKNSHKSWVNTWVSLWYDTELSEINCQRRIYCQPQLINKSREDEIGLNKDYCGARINACVLCERVWVCVSTQAPAAAVVASALIILPFSDFCSASCFKRPRGSMLAGMTIKSSCFRLERFYTHCTGIARFMLESESGCHVSHRFFKLRTQHNVSFSAGHFSHFVCVDATFVDQ